MSIRSGSWPIWKVVPSAKSAGLIPSNGAPNFASARKTASAFSSSERIKRSRSLVMRGMRCTARAWPPIMRYLTALALNARNRSLKSLVIMDRSSFEVGNERVRGVAQFADRDEAFSHRPALPVAIRLGLLLIEIGYATDSLVHARSHTRIIAVASARRPSVLPAE